MVWYGKGPWYDMARAHGLIVTAAVVAHSSACARVWCKRRGRRRGRGRGTQSVACGKIGTQSVAVGRGAQSVPVGRGERHKAGAWGALEEARSQ
jgi:hypothetical protein